MRMTSLASFRFEFLLLAALAANVSARPLPPTAVGSLQQWGEVSFEDLEGRAVQSVLRSQLSSPAIDCDPPTCESADQHTHLVPTGEQKQEITFAVDKNTAQSLPLPGILSSEAQQTNQLYDQSTTHEITNSGIIHNLDSVAPLTDVTTTSHSADVGPSGLELELSDDLTVPHESPRPLSNRASPQVLVIVFACLVAFIGVGCVIGLLVLKRLVGSYLDKAIVASDILPRLENRPLLVSVPGPTHCNEKEATDTEPKSNVSMNLLGCPSHEKNMYIDRDPILCGETTTPQKQEPDEVFHDAVEILDAVPDPDELPLAASLTPFSTPPSSPPRTPLLRTVQMLEVGAPPVTPLTRPAWSLRAAEAPTLGITSSAPTTPLPLPLRRKEITLDIPGAFHAHGDSQSGHQLPSATRRAYRAPVPQLDIAFAMQLRPGLGLGSDPAWLIRFLMAVFGWMTVLLGDHTTPSRSRRPALLG